MSNFQGHISDYFIGEHAANTSGYRTKKKNIPFYEASSNLVKVKLVYDKFEQRSDGHGFIDAYQGILTKATNRFILHYYPEFYIFYRTMTRDKEEAYSPGSEEAYLRVRAAMKANMTAIYYNPADHNRGKKHVVIATLGNPLILPLTREEVLRLQNIVDQNPENFTRSTRGTGADISVYQMIDALDVPASGATTPLVTSSPFALRRVLEILGYLPSMREALRYFNQDEEIAGPIGTPTSLAIGSMTQNNTLVNDGLASFQRQINGLEGSLPINLDFNASQRGMLQVLNAVIFDHVVEELFDGEKKGPFVAQTRGSKYVEFSDADILILQFGKRNNGTGKLALYEIDYIVNEVSISQQILKTGYMTNVLYNQDLNDALVLRTLKDYNKLVGLMESFSYGGGPAVSFWDFLGLDDGTARQDFGIPDQFVWDDIPSPVDTKNLFLKEAAKMGVLDLGDIENLSKGMATSVKREKLKEYRRKVRENPAVYRKVMMATKKKHIGTAVNVTKVIADMLEGNIPPTKPDSPLGQLLRQIGIPDLAAEALRCLTLGTAPAFARLTRAVGEVIKTAGRELYVEPTPPAAGGGSGITIPSMGDVFEAFKPPTLDGDLWPMILKVMLDALMAGVLEVVKSLAELLNDLCTLNNPRGQDYGANDLAEMVNDNLNNLNNLAVGSPSAFPSISNPAGSPVDRLFGKFGLTLAGALDYLRDLSAILSSIEICFLFTNRAELSYETLDKILEFNLAYDSVEVRNNLNTFSAITAFFAELSRFVDLTDFCNEIANELYQANIDNICLLEEAAPDRIREVLEEMAENGINLNNPGENINLECPDREDYIANPLMTNEIPLLMDTITNVIKMEFNNSLGAAQQNLKEPRIVNNESTQTIEDTITASGTGPDRPGLSTVGTDILNKTQEVFGEMDRLLASAEQHCDLVDILGVPADQVTEVFQLLVHILSQLFGNTEFLNAMEQLERAISDAAASTEAGNGTPAASYDFPQGFKEKFQNYLTGSPTFNPVSQMALGENVDIVRSNSFFSRTPGLATVSQYSDYKSPTLQFGLPVVTTGSWVPDPNGRLVGTTNFPMYILESPPENVDYIQIRYPSLSEVEASGRYIDIKLRSITVPDQEGLGLDVDDPPTTFPPSSRNTNPYASLFTDRLINKIRFDGLTAPTPAMTSKIKREVDTVLFPSAFGGLVEATFNYIEQNGIFTVEDLDALNFFHDNTNCLPEEIADLLDLGDLGEGGILEDILDEMINAMCYDEPSPDDLNPKGTKIRDVIRYGLFLLLTQIFIAQFIIKNIFVFSAFEIDDIMAMPVVKEFMATSIREQIMAFIRTTGGIVSEYMVRYFNNMLQRPEALADGGLADMDGNIIFPAGVDLVAADFPDIVEYVVRERMVKSSIPVANAIRRASPHTASKKFTRAFVDDILTIQPSFFGARAAGTTTPAFPNRRIYVRQPAAFGRIGAYPSLTSAAAATLLNSVADKIENDEQGVRTLEYGRLVLERQIIWDSVESTEPNVPVPPILERTSGAQYGLEHDLFMNVLFQINSHGIADVPQGTIPKVQFTNLRMAYNVVYYLPQHSDSDGIDNELFYDDLRLSRMTSMQLNSNITLNRVVLARLNNTLALGSSINTTDTTVQRIFRDGSWQTHQMPVLQQQLTEYGLTATNSELLTIVGDSVFNDYFGKTFSRDMVILIPLMYNLYLTNGYFAKMDNLFAGAKGRCLQIFIDTVVNQTDVVADQVVYGPPIPDDAIPPGIDRTDFNFSMLDFLNKMLIETPIQILRGVSEMMDPHVGLSKIIKDITRIVFLQLADGIDKGLAAPPGDPLKRGAPDADPPVPPLAPGLNGTGVLNLLFCALDLALQSLSAGNILWDTDQGPPPPMGGWPRTVAPDSKIFTTILSPLSPPPPGNFFVTDEGQVSFSNTGKLLYNLGENDPRDPRNTAPEEIKNNFFPRITIEGVDFTGTFLGLLMMPPGPFGIVYLLLMLLKSQMEDDFASPPGAAGSAPIANVAEPINLSDCDDEVEEEDAPE